LLFYWRFSIATGGAGGLWEMGDGRDFCKILQEGGGS